MVSRDIEHRGRARRQGYGAAAGVFAVGMMGTTLPTPLYALYRQQIGFSELIVTVVFAVYLWGCDLVFFKLIDLLFHNFGAAT